MSTSTALTATEVRVLSLLLERALALPVDEREAFIAALPERQQVLVPRLRERLAQLEHGGDAPAAAAPPPPPRPPPRAEMRVGPYRLLDPLGGDERGRVWRAERGEGAARKLFALRLPPAAAEPGSPQANAAEMQVVLLPGHEHIVRLVDAGIDAEGRFYRVLPLIEGLGLVEHAQRRGHGERAVAQLMLKVARLVAHAHEGQVACGDLQLSRLRVDDEGRVLLLDWGQGRALRAETVAADVRALGRALHALLVGTDPGAAPGADANRPARARPVAPGPDLGWVLQRALGAAAGVPPYAGVQAMVDDLKAIPAFRPVPGAPGGALHLARLSLRRNRLGLGAGVLVGALVLGVGSAGWRAFNQGQAQAQRTDQVQVFLTEQLPGPAPGADGQPPDIGVEAPRLQRALETARFGFPGNPVLRGQVITALGLRFRALGQPEQALAVLQEAVSLLQGTARAGDPALHSARLELAQQLLQVGAPGAPAQAATLARQVLDGCSAGDACTAARNAAQAVLQQAGAGR
ncbi:MAG: hypothetical protein Q7U73_07520 [Rubrivivax sp.]|nr:hypothetical protein [Rubrivivax sp.]